MYFHSGSNETSDGTRLNYRCALHSRSGSASRRSTSPPPSHPLEVGLDPLIVNRGDIVQRTRCIVGHGGFLLLVWLLSQFSQIRGRLIAVGTLITERPSHRSERAQLRHSTPTLDV